MAITVSANEAKYRQQIADKYLNSVNTRDLIIPFTGSNAVVMARYDAALTKATQDLARRQASASMGLEEFASKLQVPGGGISKATGQATSYARRLYEEGKAGREFAVQRQQAIIDILKQEFQKQMQSNQPPQTQTEEPTQPAPASQEPVVQTPTEAPAVQSPTQPTEQPPAPDTGAADAVQAQANAEAMGAFTTSMNAFFAAKDLNKEKASATQQVLQDVRAQQAGLTQQAAAVTAPAAPNQATGAIPDVIRRRIKQGVESTMTKKTGNTGTIQTASLLGE